MIGFILAMTFPAVVILTVGVCWIVASKPEPIQDEPEEECPVYRVRVDCSGPNSLVDSKE